MVPRARTRTITPDTRVISPNPSRHAAMDPNGLVAGSPAAMKPASTAANHDRAKPTSSPIAVRLRRARRAINLSHTGKWPVVNPNRRSHRPVVGSPVATQIGGSWSQRTASSGTVTDADLARREGAASPGHSGMDLDGSKYTRQSARALAGRGTRRWAVA